MAKLARKKLKWEEKGISRNKLHLHKIRLEEDHKCGRSCSEEITHETYKMYRLVKGVQRGVDLTKLWLKQWENAY